MAWFAALGLLLGACSGRLGLPAAEGRVEDRATGAAIADALVVESYRWGAPGGADVRRIAASRATRTDPAGRFHFAARSLTGPSLWLRRSYGPSYTIFHPDYGLQRSRGDGALRLDRARRDAARADLMAFCRDPGDDPGSVALADAACDNLTRSRN